MEVDIKRFKRTLRRLWEGAAEGHSYAELDLVLARRLGGAIWVAGAAYCLALSAVAAPDPGGWIGIAAIAGLAAALGAWMAAGRAPLAPGLLLVQGYASVAGVAAIASLGDAGAPYVDILVLTCLYCAALHPPRRILGILAAASVAALVPAVAEGEAIAAAGQIFLWWALTWLALAWTKRVRELRRELRVARERADALARIDALTGLGNRRALEEAVVVAAATARRTDRPLSALFADLDSFKAINDTWGHGAGDIAIRDAARAFAAGVRVPDPCFRWGGDELVALLPGAPLDEAKDIAARITETVRARCHRPDGEPLSLTIGAAQLRDGETGDEMLARADMVLMVAKAEGAGR